MTGNNKVWRASLAGLASVAMLATMGVSALMANAADSTSDTPNGKFDLIVVDKAGNKTTSDDALTAGFALSDSLTLADKTFVPADGVTNGTSVFVGWVDANGNPVDFSAPVTGDVTLAPKYVAADNAVEVTFSNTDEYAFFPVAGTADAGAEDSTYKVDVAKDETVKLPSLVTLQAGVEYTAESAWTDPANADKTVAFGSDYKASANVTFAPASPTTYKFVKFDSTGGTKVAGAYYKSGEFIQAPASPTKDNSVFAGWETSVGSNTEYKFGQEGTKVTDSFVGGTVVAYAKWDIDSSKTVKVTFKDAVYEGAQKETEVKVNNGESLTADQIPDWTRDGYVLDYWIADDTTPYAESVLTDGSKTVASLNGGQDVVLTAHWTEATTDLVEIALKYVTPDNKADFTAASWAKFEPIYKAAEKAYDTAKAQTVGQISAAKSSEIVNQLNEGWKLLQFNPKDTNGNPQKADSEHRLFNPASGEHFYSATQAEIDALTSTQHTNANWNDEGALCSTSLRAPTPT